MSGIDLIASLLADLDTLTRVSEAGVLSRREVRLEIGETRPAAILFLDMVGFTELTRLLPTHQLSTLIDRALRIFELTVQSHGGYWDARFGDAALYVFPGHPSYPPACEGALLAAMALLERARLIDQSLSGTGAESINGFTIRIGVAFGEVTRQQVGGRQYTVMGDTVNLAQRLEASAEPGTCQTTLRVLDQAGQSIAADYRGDFTLKGFGVVQVQKLIAVRPKQLRLRGSLRTLTPLIGRDRELTIAGKELERWLDAREGANHLLLIEGTTAVGKSRFAWELLQRIKSRHEIADATAHCAELASLIGFAAELLQVAGLTEANYAARWEELCSGAAAIREAEYVAACRRQLGTLSMVLGASRADVSTLSQMEPQSLLGSLQSLVRTCLELTDLGGRPMILIVEDLQWLGGLSEMVTFLLDEVKLSRPLIVLATSRLTGPPQSLANCEHVVSRLAPLTEQQGAELFQALLPGLQLPIALERELHEKAIGIPYYYEEFARMLVRRGVVAAAAEGGYQLVQQLSELDLPEDVQMLVLGRLDQLDPRLRELCGRASVLGRSFSRAMLARMDAKLGLETLHLDQDLHDLEEQHIVSEEPGGRYFFQHMLTQQAAYSALMQHNRRALHYIAAQVLEEQLVPGSVTEPDILPELATHLLKAGRTDAAHTRACQLLSLKAHSGRFENWEQWETFARATWMRLRAEDDSLPEDSSAMLTANAARHVTRGQWEEARTHYETALEHARSDGDRMLEATLLCALGSLQRGSGDFADAESSYLRALLLARELTVAESTTTCLQLEAAALRDLGTLQRERGLHAEALDYLLRALEASRSCQDRRGEAMAFNRLGLLYMDRFMADAAEDAFNQALALAREVRSPWVEGNALANLGLLHMKYMRLTPARQCLDRAIQLAQEIGDPRLEGEVAGKRANLLLRLGEADAARPELASAVALLETVGNPFQLGFVHCQWALLHIGAGDSDEARASLTRARVIARLLKLGEDSALSREIAKCEANLEQTAPVKVFRP